MMMLAVEAIVYKELALCCVELESAAFISGTPTTNGACGFTLSPVALVTVRPGGSCPSDTLHVYGKVLEATSVDVYASPAVA